MSKAFFELDKVSFQYPDGTWAVRDISFQLKQGEKVVVLGHNGAGKSTLFLLLNAIYKAKSGQLKVEGVAHDYKKKSNLQLRQKVGVVFQEPESQLCASSVRDEIAFGPLNIGLPVSEVEKRVAENLDMLALNGLKDKAPHALSFGQKKRVAIASILSMQPDIVVLDEPTAGLDTKNQTIVTGLLDELSAQDKTLLIATHNIDFAWQWADRALVLKEGELVFDGGLTDLFTNEKLLQETELPKPLALELYLHMEGKLIGSIPRDKGELKHFLGKFIDHQVETR